MLALEIQINGSELFIVVAENLAGIQLSYGVSKRDLDSVLVFGADYASRYTWLDMKAKNGDKVIVRIVDVDKDKLSSPLKINKRDRKQVMREYERLKMELQDRQMI